MADVAVVPSNMHWNGSLVAMGSRNTAKLGIALPRVPDTKVRTGREACLSLSLAIVLGSTLASNQDYLLVVALVSPISYLKYCKYTSQSGLS